MVRAVVGANWGDEGKGKITDMLGQESDIIVRFQGGANAGHTIVNDYGKFALHTLPSGVFYSHTTSIIGNGVALNIPLLFKEIKSITDRNVPMPKILVSDRAQMVMPYHILFDEYEEERLAGKSFGSTKSGIAPFYSDKYAKIGFQVSELFDEEALKEKIERVIVQKNVLLENLYHKPLLKADDIFNTLMEYKEMVAPYVCDVSAYLYEAIKEGKNILLEGQLGSLKDPDHGIYPMVTSSSTLAAYGAIGAGIPPYEIKQIITVPLMQSHDKAKPTKAFSHGKTDFERKKAGDYLSLPASASSSHGKGLKLNFDPHPHSRSEALERPQGRVGTAALQFADVCLCNTGLFGQLLLGHPAALAGVDHSLHDGELRLQSLILCPDFRILQLLVQKVIEFTHGLFSSLPR